MKVGNHTSTPCTPQHRCSPGLRHESSALFPLFHSRRAIRRHHSDSTLDEPPESGRVGECSEVAVCLHPASNKERNKCHALQFSESSKQSNVSIITLLDVYTSSPHSSILGKPPGFFETAQVKSLLSCCCRPQSLECWSDFIVLKTNITFTVALSPRSLD